MFFGYSVVLNLCIKNAWTYAWMLNAWKCVNFKPFSTKGISIRHSWCHNCRVANYPILAATAVTTWWLGPWVDMVPFDGTPTTAATVMNDLKFGASVEFTSTWTSASLSPAQRFCISRECTYYHQHKKGKTYWPECHFCWTDGLFVY